MKQPLCWVLADGEMKTVASIPSQPDTVALLHTCVAERSRPSGGADALESPLGRQAQGSVQAGVRGAHPCGADQGLQNLRQGENAYLSIIR